jgi:hypothetical protein
MTNPLLQPDDRFRPKKLTDADDANPFSEGDGVLEADAARAGARQGNTFAAAAADTSRPFLPQYITTAEHRGWLLLFIDGISLAAGCVGIFVYWMGYVLPLLGIIPAVTVIFLAADDLRMMRLGGRDPAGRGLTILALIIAALLTLGISAMCGLFAYWRISLMPEWMS